MGQQGDWTLEKIAHTWGRGRDIIVRWVRTYREGGVQRLLARRYEGRRARLSEDDQQALREGLRRAQLTLGGVYYWLKRLEASGKVPRKSHKKKPRPKKRP